MKCIDEFEVIVALEEIEEIRDGISAIAELMIGEQSELFPESILYRLGALLGHSLYAQKNLIDEINAMMEEAPAPAANLAEASGNESISRTDRDIENSRLDEPCQGISKATTEGNKIWGIYGSLFNLSKNLDNAKGLLHSMRDQLKLIEDGIVSEVFEENLSAGIVMIDAVSNSIKSRGYDLKHLLS